MQETILDEAETVTKPKLISDKHKKSLQIIIGLIVLNTALFPLLIQSGPYLESLITLVLINFLILPFMGSFFAAIIAIFPFNNDNYQQKFLGTLTMIIQFMQWAEFFMVVAISLAKLLTLA